MRGRFLLLVLLFTTLLFCAFSIAAFYGWNSFFQGKSSGAFKETAGSVRAYSDGAPGKTVISRKTVVEEALPSYKTLLIKQNILKQKTEMDRLLTRDENILKITAVGDLMLGRGVGGRLKEQHAGNYPFAFEKVDGLLKWGDIIFANLENPISNRGRPTKGKLINLRTSVEAFEAVKYGGFNLLSLANNHMMDYGEDAFLDTLEILDKNNIAHSGAGKDINEARKPAVVVKNKIKTALLSYTDMWNVCYGPGSRVFSADEKHPGVAPRLQEMILEDLKKVRGNADLVIISLHWGIEDSFNLMPEQIQFAHTLIDNGADIILGHHPHQFQGMEIYRGKPIIYSMGNFIFDQNDPENQESFLLHLVYRRKELDSLEAIPIKIVDKTQVAPQTGKDAGKILEREKGLCEKLGTKCEIVNDALKLK